MAGEAASGKLGLSRGEESALVTLFVFEILCILLYGAASALGAFGLRRDHRRAARAAKGVYLVAVAAHSAVIGMESVSKARFCPAPTSSCWPRGCLPW